VIERREVQLPLLDRPARVHAAKVPRGMRGELPNATNSMVHDIQREIERVPGR